MPRPSCCSVVVWIPRRHWLLPGETGYRPYAMTFRYGQRHRAGRSRRLARSRNGWMSPSIGSSTCDLRQFGGSALTSGPGSAQEPGRAESMGEGYRSPTCRPAIRFFCRFALAWAEVLQSRDIFIGVNALDYSGYPDCRPEFIEAFQSIANLATRAACREATRSVSTRPSATDQGGDHPHRAGPGDRLRLDDQLLRSRHPMGSPAAIATHACCGDADLPKMDSTDPAPVPLADSQPASLKRLDPLGIRIAMASAPGSAA